MPDSAPQSKATAKDRRRRVLRKLRSKYRLLLIDEATFKERFSMRLSRINVFLLFLGLFTLHGLFVSALIVFTPLKRYIPGYSDQRTKLNAYKATVKADSLQHALEIRDIYINNLRTVLSGQVPVDSVAQASPLKTAPGTVDLLPSRADSALRDEVLHREAYNVASESGAASDRGGLSGVVFFTPLRGVVTSTFDRGQDHFGIDIVTKADEAVKACLDGTVVLASWTSDAGYVIHVQHALELVSVYKHNAVLLKKQGDKVRAGEAIAIVGNSGELTSGPHLHFELWWRGDPVDPQAYMVFK
ncbi:MAG TPA: M23 family metallopeptidase [Flavobacteriales bacterium]